MPAPMTTTLLGMAGVFTAFSPVAAVVLAVFGGVNELLSTAARPSS